MKSQRMSSYENRHKAPVSTKIQSVSGRKDISYNERPTPLNFDSFIPWFCLELQVPKNIIVNRTNQASYVRSSRRESGRSSKSKLKTSTKVKIVRSAAQSDTEDKKTSAPIISYAASTVVDVKDAIPITTYYDKRGQLVEISIVKCGFEIPRRVIQAINLCLPFHPELSKFSITKGGLCQITLYEISKLLPHSNITEICLDDSHVPNGNYSMLLDRPSNIKYLSLKRCDINDQQCKDIAMKLGLNGPSLAILSLLDLTSNDITDEGARALGEILKYNRELRYLNLSGNRITDDGASSIFRYLQEFPLTDDDVYQKRRRRMEYLKSKMVVYQKCLQEVKLARLMNEIKKEVNKEMDQPKNVQKSSLRGKMKKSNVPSITVENVTVEDEAETKTIAIVGEFEDPFGEKCIKRIGDTLYCTGNLTLSSLNLAYNNLTRCALRNLLKVLKYQSEINTLPKSKGIIRVMVEGNYVYPTSCEELNDIDTFIKFAILKREQSMNQLSNLS